MWPGSVPLWPTILTGRAMRGGPTELAHSCRRVSHGSRLATSSRWPLVDARDCRASIGARRRKRLFRGWTASRIAGARRRRAWKRIDHQKRAQPGERAPPDSADSKKVFGAAKATEARSEVDDGAGAARANPGQAAEVVFSRKVEND